MQGHNYRIVWSPESETDLLMVWHWGASHFSSEIADAHLRDIEKVVASFREQPYLGRSRGDLVPGIRALVVYPTVLFYRVGTDRVEIVRVVDGRRNLAAIFSQDDQT